MESLATVLRRVPLFADLPPGGLAKIIADLREEQHPRGTVICYEGEDAHDFYIVKSGTPRDSGQPEWEPTRSRSGCWFP